MWSSYRHVDTDDADDDIFAEDDDNDGDSDSWLLDDARCSQLVQWILIYHSPVCLSPSYLHTYTQSLTINKHTHSTHWVGENKNILTQDKCRRSLTSIEISGVSMDCIWPGWVTPHSHLMASPQSGDISPANSSQYPQHSQLYSCTGFNSSYWLLDLHLSVKMSSRNTIKQFKIRDTSNRMFKTASKDFSSLNQQNHKTLPPLMWHSVNLVIIHAGWAVQIMLCSPRSKSFFVSINYQNQ